MKVPISWLGAYCDPGLPPDRLAERLSMTGTEVERVGTAGAPSPDGFVVGRVLAAEQHPDADRLRVCTVDAGEGGERTIVCGAPNVAAGQTVAVALPGARLGDGTKLRKAKLRGVESAGMILSETEMEIGDDADGIAVLETDAAPGTALSEVLPIAETVLDLEITPNRPDCLGVYGIAREVHAITGAELGPEPWAEDAEATGSGDVADLASVTVEVPDLCPRFTARAFTDVKIGPSPLWLKARLAAAGQRPINNVVDITNYVMLLTGQPLHAFDLDRVPGGAIIVRAASEGETMTTLDDVERVLDSESVVVCDRDGPSGIAGIMGGQVSEVSAETTRVLLEVACWNGTNILRTSNLLGLRSEASTRFEKQLHPELTMRGQRVASKLMVELCGARLVPGTIDVDNTPPPMRPFDLSYHPGRSDRLLGMEVDPDRAAEYLGRLGFHVHGSAPQEAIAVTVPADRHFDVTREIDLVEEVARVHGLDEHLPATLPGRGGAVGGLARHQVLLRRVEDLVRDAGLDEAITWSFVDPARGGFPGLGEIDPVVVHNPLSEDQSVMRTDLIGGLLAACAHNLARGAERVAVFESGRVYLPQRPPGDGGALGGRFAGSHPPPVAEPHRIAAALIGELTGHRWRGSGGPADFYDAKGLIELIAAALGLELSFEAGSRPFLHPGRAATVLAAGEPIGWVGELHPEVLARIDARAGAAFELGVEPLVAAATTGDERYEDVTTHPAVAEDIAVVADAGVGAERIRETILEAGGALLARAEVFDVYEGEQVPEGKRSLALRLDFRAPDRTLTDAEVAEVRAGIVAALGGIGADLRG
ncbi:MAG: phenylalanine--tRNA ligase subunit beta [Solirubrobacterales bacterium]